MQCPRCCGPCWIETRTELYCLACGPMVTAERIEESKALARYDREMEMAIAGESEQGAKPIQKGYCQCGCGQKTELAPYNKAQVGWVAGQPKRFIHGHSTKRIRQAQGSALAAAREEEDRSDGLCMCGCGEPTPLAPRTKKAAGWIKGKPMRFLNGHHMRLLRT